MKPTFVLLIIMLFFSCDPSSNKSDSDHDLPEVSAEQPRWEKLNKRRQQYKWLLSQSKLSPIQMDSLVKIMDQKQKTGKFQAFAYPEKSTCGGALTGFYEEDQLVMTKAKNSGEAGYTDRLIYWNGNHIIKMILLEHTPDMDEYFDKYPLEKFEFDMDKLTYHDKRYEITLGTKPKIEISLDGRKLSNQVDSNLVNNLIDCGIFMKAELEMEKVPKVESR